MNSAGTLRTIDISVLGSCSCSEALLGAQTHKHTRASTHTDTRTHGHTDQRARPSAPLGTDVSGKIPLPKRIEWKDVAIKWLSPSWIGM